MLIKSKILAKEGKMSVAQNALGHQFNVSQSSSLVSVVTDDDDIFMGIAGKMRSSFCQAIGQKNKIIAFYSPNELVQRKYLFKLIAKINSRLNDEIINLHPSWATNVKLAFERKNSVQIIVSVPLNFDRNSVIFDTKNCDEMLKKYFIKMLGAKHRLRRGFLMMCSQNENTLIQNAKCGDNLAFEKLSFRYLGLIHKLSNQYKVEGYDTNDFVQEGLLALLSAVKSFDPNHSISFKNYALLCVKNRFRTIVKKSQRDKAIPMSSTVPFDEQLDVTDHTANPENQVLNEERFALLLEKARDVLSQKEYKVLTYYINGYSYMEISEKLGIDKKSVDNALSRAKKKLL